MTLASPPAADPAAAEMPVRPTSTPPEMPVRPTSTPPDKWIRIKPAADYFGLPHPRTLYRLTAERKVPFRRLPGTSIIAFAPEDLEQIAEMSLIAPIGHP